MTILDDTTFEGDETITLTLSGPTGGVTLGTTSTATLAIVENEPPPDTTPAITSPSPGSTLTSSSATFQWSSGAGVSEYFIDIGRTPGSNEIYHQSQGLNLSVAVSGLPEDGSKLYVRLWWNTSTGWQQSDYIYTTGGHVDADGDGYIGTQEDIAGTDPLNPASALRITAIWEVGSAPRAKSNCYPRG